MARAAVKMSSVKRSSALAVAVATGVVVAGWWLRPARSEAHAPARATPRAGELRYRLSDGARAIGLSGDDVLVGLDDESSEVRALVGRALASGRLETPDFSGLGGRPIGDPGVGPESRAFELSEPIGIVVESAVPRLRWQAAPGASRYVVSLFDEDLEPLAVSPPLTAPEWTPTTPLARGRIYVWQVAAQVRGTRIVAPRPPAPDARFEVLGDAGVAAVARAREPGRSRLALAAVLARYGLLDGAARELKALEAANPDSGRLREIAATLMPTDLE